METTPRRAALIVNPTAGRSRAGRSLPAIRKALASAGLDLRYYFTQACGDGERCARTAIFDGADLIVAVGGDGTLNEVVNAILGSAHREELTLGLIPFGTGNDFARGVGLHGDLTTACRALTQGRRHAVDIGMIEGSGLGAPRHFLVAAGIGFTAETARTVNEGVRFLRGAPAYVYGALKTLKQFQPFAIDIRINGTQLKIEEATLISISNVETTGGGMKIAPGAAPDDGVLNVCLVGDVSRRVLLEQLPRVFHGKHVDHPQVFMLRASSVDIATREPHALWIDGEVTGCTPARITVQPGALPMMLPAAQEGDGLDA